MSSTLQSREHNPGTVAPFLQAQDPDPADHSPGDITTLPPELRSLLREFRGLASQRDLPLPDPGEGPYEHRDESERGKTYRLMGRICTGLGCVTGAGLTVATVNFGAYAVPGALASASVSYLFTLIAGGGLRLALNAYPNNPESLVVLRHIATGTAVVASVSLGSVMFLRFAEDPATLGWLSLALLGFEGSLLLAGATLETMGRVYLWSTTLLQDFAAAKARIEANDRKCKYDKETHRKG